MVLIFDTVHLLKCLRNNWISEKSQTLTFDGNLFAKFSDVEYVYQQENMSLLRATPLNRATVYPARLQLQNVKLVVNLFNDKVATCLKLCGRQGTAEFVAVISTWWKIVNVCGPSEDLRFNDACRMEQTPSSTNLEQFQQLFSNAPSGHGYPRVHAMTHDTKKALVQTMDGYIALCKYLYSQGKCLNIDFVWYLTNIKCLCFFSQRFPVCASA